MCDDSGPGQGHLLTADFDKALDAAMVTVNPRIVFVSVDLTRGGDVLVTTVVPGATQHERAAAGGDVTRLVVESPTSVTALNRSKRN